MANVDTWSETAFLAISVQGGSDIQFKTLTETISIDIGEKGFDVMHNICGGGMVKFNPQEPTEITLEAYPVEAGTDTGTTGKGFFDLLHTADATQPVVIPLDHTRTKCRMVILWTDDASIVTAEEVVPTIGTNSGMRVVAADGFFTKAEIDFTDKVQKWTLTFKIPAFDKTNVANVKVESTDGSADLTAVPSYTTSTKF